MPSARCWRPDPARRLLGRPASVRMPRNWRSSRSSASIVTLVSSSPFHQPSASWQRRAGARPRASSASPRPRRGGRRASPAAVAVQRSRQLSPRHDEAGRARSSSSRRGGVEARPPVSAVARPGRSRRAASAGGPVAAAGAPRSARRARSRRRRRRSAARRRRSQPAQLGAGGAAVRRARSVTGSDFLRARRSEHDRLAGDRRVAPDAEQVVDELERQPELAAERRQRGDGGSAARRPATAPIAARARRAARRSCRPPCPGTRRASTSSRVSNARSCDLAADQLAGAPASSRAARPRPAAPALEQHLVRQREQRVAGQDRRRRAARPPTPCGGAGARSSPSIRSSCSSEKLCTSSTATAPGTPTSAGAPAASADEQRQRGPDRLAAAAGRRVPVARRSSRGGSAATGRLLPGRAGRPPPAAPARPASRAAVSTVGRVTR